MEKKVERLDQIHTKIGDTVQKALQDEGFFDEKVEVVNNLNELSDDGEDSPKRGKKKDRPTGSQLDGIMRGSITSAIPEEPIEVEGLDVGESVEGQTAGRATPTNGQGKVDPLDMQETMAETLGNSKFNHLKMNT